MKLSLLNEDEFEDDDDDSIYDELDDEDEFEGEEAPQHNRSIRIDLDQGHDRRRWRDDSVTIEEWSTDSDTQYRINGQAIDVFEFILKHAKQGLVAYIQPKEIVTYLTNKIQTYEQLQPGRQWLYNLSGIRKLKDSLISANSKEEFCNIVFNQMEQDYTLPVHAAVFHRRVYDMIESYMSDKEIDH